MRECCTTDYNIIWRGKVYFSNHIIITNFTQTVIPDFQFENLSSLLLYWNSQPMVVKGLGEVGDSPGPPTCRGPTCLTPVPVCIRITFPPCIVAIVFLIHVLLSETNNNEEGIKNVFNKSL
jgi:hypothetical protein